MGAATACAIFAAWFLEKLRGIDYEKEYPFLVPISCVTGILSGVCFWIGMWQVQVELHPMHPNSVTSQPFPPKNLLGDADGLLRPV